MTEHTDFQESKGPGGFERFATSISKHLITKLLLILLAVGAIAWLGGKFLGNDPDEDLREEFARFTAEVIPAIDSARVAAVASENAAWDSVGASNKRVKGLTILLAGATAPLVIHRTITTPVGEPGPLHTVTRDEVVSVVLTDTATGALDTIDVHPKVAAVVEQCTTLAAECALFGARLDTALIAKAVTDSINEVLRDSLNAAIDVATVIIEPSRVPLLGIPWKALKPVGLVSFSATYNVLKCEESTTATATDGGINTTTTTCPSRLAFGPSVGVGWVIHF